MADQEELFPLEFFIERNPVSSQGSSRSKELWMAIVGNAAKARIRDVVDWVFLDDRPMAVTILYFCDSRMDGDVDNIVKPILDGMKAVVYLDDRVVERVWAQRFEPGNERGFMDVSQKLADALVTAPPVIYVRVDDDLSWRRL